MEKYTPENNENIGLNSERRLATEITSNDEAKPQATDTERAIIEDAEQLRDVREKLSAMGEKNGEKGVIELQVGKKTVSVEWECFLPEKETGEKITSPKNNLFFFNGWGMDSDSKSPEVLIKSLANEVTKNGHSAVYSLSTRTEQLVDNSLMVEAEAVRRIIEDKGIEEIILAGYSRGGLEAAILAAIMEKKSPDIKIDGLILLDPVGIQDQKNLELMYNFYIENGLKSFVKSPTKKFTEIVSDIVSGLIKEIKKSKLSYPKRITKEITQMARKNPLLENIKSQIIIIQGKHDTVSAPEKRRIPKNNYSPETKEYNFNEINIKEIFPNSKKVKFIQGRGHHDMPIQRAEQIAAASLHLLRSSKRESSFPSEPEQD